MARDFVVIGDQALRSKLEKLSRRVVSEGARKAVRAGSTPMLQAMRPTIPKGPSGNLRKGLKRKIKRNTKLPGAPMTANIFIAAPHVALVRYGTKGPRKYSGMMSNLNAPGKNKGYAPGPPPRYFALGKRSGKKATFFGREVARMPANPSFSKTYDQQAQGFVREVRRVMLETINQAVAP